MRTPLSNAGRAAILAFAWAWCAISSVGVAEEGTALDRDTVASAATQTEASAEALLETLSIAAIPLHTRTRLEFMSDLLSDAEHIQHESRALIRKLDADISDKHIKKRVERMTRDFRDLERSKEWLMVPPGVEESIRQLGAAVRDLERVAETNDE